MNTAEAVIEKWIRETSSNGGVERFDDLHVDEIDADWKPKSKWLQGAFQSFRLALPLRDRLTPGLSMVLGFHLIDAGQPLGLTFKTPHEFERNLSTTPPSLYLMRKGTEFWIQTPDPDICEVTVREFHPAVIGAPFSDVVCHFMEFRRASIGEYTRSVFVHS